MDSDDTVATIVDARDEKPALCGLPLLFVVWLGVIGPLYSFALNGFFTMRWGAMYPPAVSYYASWHFWWFIAARELSRMLAAVTMVVRRSADAVWFAILVLWLSGPTLVTVTWLLFGNMVMPAALIRSTAIAAAATLYLTRSARVRAIYPLKPSKLSSSSSQFAEG